MNDLCMILSLIAPTRQMAASLADPATFLERHAPELEMAARLVRARVDPTEGAGAASPSSGPPASPGPSGGMGEAVAARDRSQDLGSLLR